MPYTNNTALYPQPQPAAPPVEGWYQLWVNVPGGGDQFAAWMRTDIARATMIAMTLRACGGAVAYRVTTQDSRPVLDATGAPAAPGVAQLLGMLGSAMPGGGGAPAGGGGNPVSTWLGQFGGGMGGAGLPSPGAAATAAQGWWNQFAQPGQQGGNTVSPGWPQGW